MILNCLIVEDEPLARSLMTQYVQKVASLHLVKACANPLEAIEILSGREATDNGLPIDILFLDVQMPEITGIGLLKILKNKPYIILTTAYSEYALEGYELDVMDYLLKPITFERFLKAVEKASQRLAQIRASAAQADSSLSVVIPSSLSHDSSLSEPVLAQPPFIFVKDGTKLVKIKLDDIQYVEGLKDYVSIHTPDKKITTLQRMKTLEEELPQTHFVRIHNSYIVALNWLDVIHKDKVQIGKIFLPISDTYRKSFKEFIERQNIRLE